MLCKNCNYPESRVVETRQDDNLNQIRRRRECIKCGLRYTTQEHLRDVKKSSYKTTPPKRVLEK
jgi:transcriptional repressor NrdR